MDDGNLIARLFPNCLFKNDYARQTTRMLENKPHYFRKRYFSTLGTYEEGLQLRFDSQRKNREGFLIGGTEDCDIVLPFRQDLKSISDYQCLITFDQQGRLIIRDLKGPEQARSGTTVTYGGEGGFIRSGFTWILSGEPFTSKPIKICLHEWLTFHLEVARHDVRSREYLKKVTEFRRMTSVPRIRSNSTLRFLLASTMGCRQIPILLDDAILGVGGQAVVRKVWHVSTGEQYASKEPLNISGNQWIRLRGEAELLGKIRHDNIVRCLFTTELPKRRLVFEYIPLGSLRVQAGKQPVTSSENIQILTQALAALRFLHGQEKPIAHRDVKPDNILVCSRDPLHIKLSDFGFSKRNQQDLRTFVGTHWYMAPEIMMLQQPYSEKVDIWSLGLVALQFSHGLPPCPVMAGTPWAQKIVDHIRCPGQCDLLMFLKMRMLRIQPGERASASVCLRMAENLAVSSCCARSSKRKRFSAEDDDPTTTQTTTGRRDLIKHVCGKKSLPRRRIGSKVLGQKGDRRSLRIQQRGAKRWHPYASSLKPVGQALKRRGRGVVRKRGRAQGMQ